MVHRIATVTLIFLVLALCLSVPSVLACGMKAGKSATSTTTPSVSVA